MVAVLCCAVLRLNEFIQGVKSKVLELYPYSAKKLGPFNDIFLGTSTAHSLFLLYTKRSMLHSQAFEGKYLFKKKTSAVMEALEHFLKRQP